LSVRYGQVEHGRAGEALRAGAERERGGRIARYFAENGILYLHEAAAPRDRSVFKGILAKPDFYLPDFGVYVEYWGMAHAGPEYAEQMRRRMAAYNRKDIRFISLFPEDLGKLGLVFRSRFREVAGFELPHAVPRSHVRLCSRCGTPPEPDAKFCGKCLRNLV